MKEFTFNSILIETTLELKITKFFCKSKWLSICTWISTVQYCWQIKLFKYVKYVVHLKEVQCLTKNGKKTRMTCKEDVMPWWQDSFWFYKQMSICLKDLKQWRSHAYAKKEKCYLENANWKCNIYSFRKSCKNKGIFKDGIWNCSWSPCINFHMYEVHILKKIF